ncbi:MAG: GNAT family N-acetyltransferase [Magnetococcales bacterium]|nr:GNAT family N-acetyltransferase [Magnetococcales bacterium]
MSLLPAVAFTGSVREVVTSAEVAVVRSLFEEYQRVSDRCYCFSGFAREMARLPEGYAPPGGALWLAWGEDGQGIGCLGLRPFKDGVGELRRLFVKPFFRRLGVGRGLVSTALTRAREVGYTALRLEVADTMPEALGLYESLGFCRGAPPVAHAPAGIRFLNLPLKVPPIDPVDNSGSGG